jgi:hypothetical protein
MTAIAPADDAAIVQATRHLGDALRNLRAAPELALAMEPAVSALLALDALAEARKRLSRDLAKAMLAEGCEQFRDGPRTVSACAGRVSVTLVDANAVPKAMRKLVPDLAVIRPYLEDHPECNWGTLESGEPYITIRTKG